MESKHDVKVEQEGKEATVKYMGFEYDYAIGESSFRDKDGNVMPHAVMREIMAKLEKLTIERNNKVSS